MTTTAIQRRLAVDIPTYNARDVEFLREIQEAHKHDSLSKMSAAIEAAFKRRVEDEFLNEEITPKIRADITEFCNYLVSISRFYGYNLLTGAFIISIHGDMFTIKTNPSGHLNPLIDAIFTYFDNEGNYKLTASGYMRYDWQTAPDDSISRREQIKRDNNDTMPGLDYNDSETFHIHIEIKGQFPLLVLPTRG